MNSRENSYFPCLHPQNRIKTHEIALIKRGGGKRPDEARQPACPNRKGANSGGLCVPRDEGIEHECPTPEDAGAFLCLLTTLLGLYPCLKWKERNFANEQQFYA